jgi:hypothetical protein
MKKLDLDTLYDKKMEISYGSLRMQWIIKLELWTLPIGINQSISLIEEQLYFL